MNPYYKELVMVDLGGVNGGPYYSKHKISQDWRLVLQGFGYKGIIIL